MSIWRSLHTVAAELWSVDYGPPDPASPSASRVLGSSFLDLADSPSYYGGDAVRLTIDDGDPAGDAGQVDIVLPRATLAALVEAANAWLHDTTPTSDDDEQAERTGGEFIPEAFVRPLWPYPDVPTSGGGRATISQADEHEAFVEHVVEAVTRRLLDRTRQRPTRG